VASIELLDITPSIYLVAIDRRYRPK
jgi:hypothetical protein